MNISARGMNSYKNTLSDHLINSSLRASESKEESKLKEATIDFETLFVKQMLNSMKKTVNKSGLIDGGMGQEIFEDMLYDKYAEKISRTANLGISDMMFKQLSTVKPVF